MIQSRRTATLSAGILLCLALMAGNPPASFASGEFDRAARLGMLGDYEGALKEYQDFAKASPGDELAPLAILAAGNIQLEVREDYDAAARSYDQVIAGYPSSPWAAEAARRKGDAARALENWKSAGDAYAQALDLAAHQPTRQPDAWVNEVTAGAGDCYYEAGDQDRVLEIYRKVLENDPPVQVAATALYRLGETYEARNEPAMAARSYARMLEEYPGAGIEPIRRAMGKRELIDRHEKMDWRPYEIGLETNGLIRARDFSGALEKCNEAEALCTNPRLLECVEYQKIALETTISGDFEAGYRRMESYVQKYPNGQMAPQIEQNLDQWAQIVDAKAESDRDPGNAEIAAALGTMYLRAGAVAKAVETLERARDLDPGRDATYQLLGYAYNAAGRADEAVAAFETYLETNPTDANAINIVGYSFLGREQYEKAIIFFKKYVEIAPDEPNAHDSLGEGYFRAGHLEEAAREYEKAVELDPTFFNSFFFLGQIYQQQEKKDKAIAAYERLIELSPNGTQAEEARAALRELRG